jgi:hypothetical protein
MKTVKKLDSVTASLALVTLALFVSAGWLVAQLVTFPSQVDELQHLSFIRWMASAPTLFPHYGSMPTLAPDLSHWTQTTNYLAHPPLFYLLLSLFPLGFKGLRIVDLTFATLGIALALAGGLRMCSTRLQGLLFVPLAAVFPRSVVTAGMINNDNLVLLEAGALIFLLSASEPNAVLVAIVLAATGWTKLNAFVGLATIAAIFGILKIRERRPDAVRSVLINLIGVAVGSIPSLANLVNLHRIAYLAIDFLEVPVAKRQHFTFIEFAAAFIHRLGEKFPFVEGSFDATWILAGCIVLACIGTVSDRTTHVGRRFAIASTGAIFVFFSLHITYAWRSFQALGTVSDAQMRYYNMLWPGLAFSMALGLEIAIGWFLHFVASLYYKKSRMRWN